MLLDSHVLLWLMDDSPRLAPQVRAQIIASDRCHFSAASVWELTMKNMLGKLDLGPQFESDLLETRLIELPVTAAHGRAPRTFPELTRTDPFDRILAAQSSAEGRPLVTADRILLAVPGLRTIDATR